MNVGDGARHRNQFFICVSALRPTPPREFSRTAFTADIDIFHSDPLPVYRASGDDAELALVGDVAIPEGPTVQRWVDETVSEPLDDFLRASQGLTGRYVIIHSYGGSTTVIPDPLAHKSLYYHRESALVTSSLKLLLDSTEVETTENPRVRRFMNSDAFGRAESALVGDTTPFEEFNCVLPNHILDLDEMRASRRPLFVPDVRRPPAKYIADRISAAMASFNDRYDLHIALTAGWDSRTILACSKDIVESIPWYTFSTRDDRDPPDVLIPKRIASEHDFDYTVYHPRRVDDDFRAALTDHLCWTRELPKTEHVQFFYNRPSGGNDLYVTGNGPIYKATFEPPEDDENLVDHVCDVLEYPDNDFVREEVEAWLPGALDYAERYDISFMDLVYWEQRMGRWGSLAPHEMDICIRGVSPFSNYDLLLTGLHVDRNRRSHPDYDLLHDVIETKWPELLQYKFNPRENRLKATVASIAPSPVEQLLKFAHSKVS